MVKEMCTKNSLPCLWEAFGVKLMTERLYMTLAVDYGGLLVPFRLFVISQRNNATRKDEKTK